MGMQHADLTIFPIFFWDSKGIRLNRMKENQVIKLALKLGMQNFYGQVDNSILQVSKKIKVTFVSA